MSGSNSDRIGRRGVPQNPPADERKRRQAGIRAAIEEVKKGETASAEDVEAWIESWGTPNELQMPGRRRH